MDVAHARPDASRKRSPLAHFLLVFALSVPFWLIGESGRQLLPGLPVSALAVVCPVAAASILVYREAGPRGVVGLLRRSFDFRRVPAKRWYLAIVLLMPAVAVVAYAWMGAMGRPVPAPDLSPTTALALLAVFFVAGLAEELGWSGYALDPLQERWTALGAGVLLGLVWAAWHGVPLMQAHRSVWWIGWWCLYTVAGRVVITWLYDNTGRSVFAAALFHATGNISWQLFPTQGSHWDPRVFGLILAAVAAVVTIGWGPRTLAGRG